MVRDISKYKQGIILLEEAIRLVRESECFPEINRLNKHVPLDHARPTGVIVCLDKGDSSIPYQMSIALVSSPGDNETEPLYERIVHAPNQVE